jgi:sugar diacid utilization regulator
MRASQIIDSCAQELRIDPSRRRLAPAADELYRATLEAFAAVAEALLDTKELDALLHHIAERFCQLTDVNRCSLFLRDEKTGLFQGQVAHPHRIGDARIKRLVAGIPADRFTHEIVETMRPVAVLNALDDPRPVRATVRAWNVRSMLGVPLILRGQVIGIAILDNEGEPHVFSRRVGESAATFAGLAASAISQARATSALRESIATIGKQNKLLRQAAAVEERLSDLLHEGADLGAFAQAVAEMTGKPTAIHDAQHRRLVAAVSPHANNEVVPRLLDDAFVRHPAVQDGLDSVSRTRGGVIGPLPAAGLQHRFLVTPIVCCDQETGHLVIMEYGSGFDPLDRRVARHAATKIALALTVERRAQVADQDARAVMTADLVSGTLSGELLERRARSLGIDPGARRVLCLVACDEAAHAAVPSLDRLRELLSRLLDGAEVLVTAAADGIVAIVETDASVSGIETAVRVRALFERAFDVLGGRGLRAAISSRCTIRSGGCARAYDEARQVMACMRSLADESSVRVLAADELGAGRVLLAASDRDAVRRFAQDVLGPLLLPQDGTPELLRTLQTFFDSSRSVRRSAAVLEVHENTIRYRLGRIENLTGLAVATDSDDQLTVQLALLIRRLAGGNPDHAHPPDALAERVAPPAPVRA